MNDQDVCEALRAEREALRLFVDALLEDAEERRQAGMARVHAMADGLRQAMEQSRRKASGRYGQGVVLRGGALYVYAESVREMACFLLEATGRLPADDSLQEQGLIHRTSGALAQWMASRGTGFWQRPDAVYLLAPLTTPP